MVGGVIVIFVLYLLLNKYHGEKMNDEWPDDYMD